MWNLASFIEAFLFIDLNMNKGTKLTVIVFSDIVDYTKISSESQSSAMTFVKQHQEHTKSLLKKYNGVLLKNLGDGLLLKFESTRESVLFSIDLQKLEKSYEIRISINQGDVIQQDSDIYGDGVNIASRINSYSPKGGIVLSKSVADDVNSEKDISLINIGEYYLKGKKNPFILFVVKNKGVNVKQKIVKSSLWGKATTIFNNRQSGYGTREYTTKSIFFYCSSLILMIVGALYHYLLYFYLLSIILQFSSLDFYITYYISTYLNINSPSVNHLLGFVGMIVGSKNSGCEFDFKKMEVKLSISKRLFIRMNKMEWNLRLFVFGTTFDR